MYESTLYLWPWALLLVCVVHAHACTNAITRNILLWWLAYFRREFAFAGIQERCLFDGSSLLSSSRRRFQPNIATIYSPYLPVENFFISRAKRSILETEVVEENYELYTLTASRLRVLKMNNKYQKFCHWVYYLIFFTWYKDVIKVKMYIALLLR